MSSSTTLGTSSLWISCWVVLEARVLSLFSIGNTSFFDEMNWGCFAGISTGNVLIWYVREKLLF